MEVVEREITIKGKIALCSLQNISVWHYAGVAHSTRQDPNLDLAFFLHHITEVGQRAVFCDRRASLLQELPIPNVKVGRFRPCDSSLAYRCIKYYFPCIYPVRICFKRWRVTFVIPINDRVFMFERL